MKNFIRLVLVLIFGLALYKGSLQYQDPKPRKPETSKKIKHLYYNTDDLLFMTVVSEDPELCLDLCFLEYHTGELKIRRASFEIDTCLGSVIKYRPNQFFNPAETNDIKQLFYENQD